MSKTDLNNAETTTQIFDDPVAYLARFGIEAEIVPEADVVATTAMPAAA